MQARRSVLFLVSSLGFGLSGCGSAVEGVAEEAVPTNDLVQRVKDPTELARMQQHLDSLYDTKDVRHHFQSPDGDDIDCVDLYRQPALRQPGMESHVIQFAPSTFPKELDEAPTGPAVADARQPAQAELAFSLDATGAVQRCPQGTIPILRVTLDTLKRFKSLEDFRSKVPSHLSGDALRAGSTALHQYAAYRQTVDNLGAESALNVWNPAVEVASEFSLSQIWVARGSGADTETVEGGWQNYRNLYGDNNSRLFIYFTPDNYGSGGCYNLTCAGFVQTDTSIVIGSSFTNYSASGGAQHEIKLFWFKDGTAGNWWLRVGTTWVGYYPRTKFDANGIADKGGRVTFGGEIINNQTAGRHTHTDMGSGAFAAQGWQQAAYQRQIQYVDTANVYRSPASLSAITTDSFCYDSSAVANDTSAGGWGRYFYFGGSGYNANCT
ncbi:neprosin family prolyl endopeptidase [Pyxidicoccus trucidator]|uniref:neprosin family prolyl endopeptidase n=1 Tax=Pyxidicoccus trucidator TaxID=2709662 RepID=UPI0013D9970F|nr:neprosin family prolyl endopeptidase [Pyxidicoccus trucidator]